MNGLQDVLTILLAIEFFIITACIVLVSYFLVKALKTFTRLAESLGKVKSLISIPALLIAIVGKILRRGR